MKTEAEYVQEKGNRCPHCDSRDISAPDNVIAEAGVAWQDVECNGCGTTWKDTYVLTGFTVEQ